MVVHKSVLSVQWLRSVLDVYSLAQMAGNAAVVGRYKSWNCMSALAAWYTQCISGCCITQVEDLFRKHINQY